MSNSSSLSKLKANQLLSSVKRVSDPVVGRVWNFLDKLGLSFVIEDAFQSTKMAIRSPRKKQIQYLIDFDQWVKDGANLLDAVREMKTAALRLGKKRSFEYRASVSIERALLNGYPVSAGMKGAFSRDLISLFQIGEETESISDLFIGYVREEEERQAVFKGKVKSLVYPGFLLLLTISILLAIHDYGIPLALENGLNLKLLSGLPGRMIGLSEWLSKAWPWISTLMIGTWLFYRVTRDYYVRKWAFIPSRSALDKVFPYSIHKEFVAMGIVQRIGLLSNVGMPIGATVKVLMKTATPYERHYYERIQRNTTSTTGTVADYLNVGLLNADVFQRLSGVAKQEGESTKIKAILAASRESGAAAKRSLTNMLFGIQATLWVLFALLGGVTGLGLVLLTFQIKHIISIN